jgi:hypothetical protein
VRSKDVEEKRSANPGNIGHHIEEEKFLPKSEIGRL